MTHCIALHRQNQKSGANCPPFFLTALGASKLRIARLDNRQSNFQTLFNYFTGRHVLIQFLDRVHSLPVIVPQSHGEVGTTLFFATHKSCIATPSTAAIKGRVLNHNSDVKAMLYGVQPGTPAGGARRLARRAFQGPRRVRSAHTADHGQDRQAARPEQACRRVPRNVPGLRAHAGRGRCRRVQQAPASTGPRLLRGAQSGNRPNDANGGLYGFPCDCRLSKNSFPPGRADREQANEIIYGARGQGGSGVSEVGLLLFQLPTTRAL
jgi:hypothetical protein